MKKMWVVKGWFPGFGIALCLLILVQCTGLFPTNIGDITKNPREFAGKSVTVSGKVVEPFSLLVVKYFTLRDSTGEIVIVTNRPLPKEGESMKITGMVREAFSLGTKTLLVIEEEPEGGQKEKPQKTEEK
jgi:hypothetical protein